MLETLADFDDEVMECFLAGEIPDEKKIKKAIRMAAIGEKLIPVLAEQR